MSGVSSVSGAFILAPSRSQAGEISVTSFGDGSAVLGYEVGGPLVSSLAWDALVLDPNGAVAGVPFELGPLLVTTETGQSINGMALRTLAGVQPSGADNFVATWTPSIGGLGGPIYSYTVFAGDGTKLTQPASLAVFDTSTPRSFTALGDGSFVRLTAEWFSTTTGVWPASLNPPVVPVGGTTYLNVSAQLLDASGTAIGPAVDVSGTEAGSGGAVLSVALAGGGFAAVWQHDAQWQARVYAAGGVASGPAVTLLADPAPAAGAAQTSSDIVSLLPLPGGGFAAVWAVLSPSGSAFFYQPFTATGAAAGAAFALAPFAAADPTQFFNPTVPPLALLSDGNLVVLQSGADAVRADILSSSGALLSETAVEAGGWSHVAVAALAGGRFVVTGQVADGIGGFQAEAQVFQETACFAAGTHIRTTQGDVAVERLRPGDYLPVRIGGGDRAVIWTGHREVDCARHPTPWDVWPVRVRAHAFGPGRPYADLLLSPDHAVFVGGVLIPVRYLLNGCTVTQEKAARVTYWHVEVSGHDVLLAEGLPCESYLDTGNRGAFADAGAPVMLHADFARRRWAEAGCAALTVSGPAVVAARGHLLAEAARQGFRLTRAPHLRILADGRPVAARVAGKTWTARLPAGARTLVLASRVWTPAQSLAESADARRLGVAIRRVRVDGAACRLDDARLGAGWRPGEAGWRWTDGAGEIAVAGVREIAFDVAMTGRYWADVTPVPAANGTGAGTGAVRRKQAIRAR